MHLRGVIWTVGILTALFGVGMMLPAIVALHFDTGNAHHFVVAGCSVSLLGLICMRFTGKKPDRLSHRDGFLIVALAWLILSFLGAMPFWTTGTCTTLMDGLFESTSGLTTTGATILTGLDKLPPSILFWRSMQEWLGGMGIIVLAIAVMPLLGVGGMQLFRAETPGPVKNKLTSRVTETAKVLWFIYLAMTLICMLLLWGAGMSLFDAINHAMCTVAIGGFSTHDASIGYYYDEIMIRWTIIIFMFLAGINFTLHFAALKRGFSLKGYLQDEEFKVYCKWLIFLIISIAIISYDSNHVPWQDVVFNTVAVATTTGFAVSDYAQWPSATALLMIAAMFVGACAGSTGGGMKVVRVLLLWRQGMREIMRLIHPHALFPVKIGQQGISNEIMQTLWGFFILYMICYAVIATLLAVTGVDILTSLSATAACLTNTGPGFAQVGPANNYADLPQAGKGILLFAMILGRLEIFTFFVLLVPEFWRK
ncbi:MAG: TrkH family potassium uptake protein [Mariprofundaceae bacterium]|nr:TrkH family potassium uptake protein [Mariprofundaceae bacterium]